MRLVAGRLGLSEQLVGSLAASGSSAETGSGGSTREGRGRPATAPRAALDRREQTERTFLALCIALPDQGRDALRRVDLDRHFTSALSRRAAAHLRRHLGAPLDGIAPDDRELSGLIAELALRAARDPADPATLEVELLQLEKERLEREIASAQASGGLEVADLADQRGKVRERLESAIDRATALRAE